MDSLERKKTARFLVLQSLYDRTDGNPNGYVDSHAVGAPVGLDEETAENALDYLIHEGLAKRLTFDSVQITHRGVKEIEAARSHPREATRYFPPVFNIINVHTMTNSQIQQGSHGSTQSQTIGAAELEQLREFVAMLKAELPKVELSATDAADAKADVATAEAQLSASRPKVAIVRESLRSVRNVLEGAAGSVVATELLLHFPAIMQVLERAGHHLG